MLVILAVPALSLLFLQNRQVQTKVSKYLTEQLSEELQVPVSLSSVSYSFFRRVQIKDLYIEDLHGDTLVYIGLTKLRIKQFRPEPKGLTIKKITAEDLFMNLVIDSANVVNIKHFTDRIKNPHRPPELKPRIHIASIDLIDSRFSLTKMDAKTPRTPITFSNFHLGDLQITVTDLEVARDTVRMHVQSLHGVESCGFVFEKIVTDMSISRDHMHFYDIAALAGESDLRVPVLAFNFEKFSGFKYFSRMVDLKFITEQSRLRLEDLAYFAPLIPDELLDELVVDGHVSGKLNDMKGEDLNIVFDDRSQLACDFMMIGLPDFNNTFIDFDFKRLNTNVRAIHSIVGLASDSSASIYPWGNLGKVAFAGDFTGYPDDFVASGLLATDLGRMELDLSFKPNSLHGVDFLGRLRTKEFQLGKFFSQEETLDQLDMDVYTKGSLDDGQIMASLEGRIDTLDIFNYAYSNITLDGAFTNSTFEGGFSVVDPNIQMDFQGRTDFSGDVPVHRFTADVARARPFFLNLPQSDPNYFISFLVKTDLSGGSIDDLNGEIVLVNSLFEKTDAQVQVYDLTLTTRNTPAASLIRLRSQMLDVDLTGQYKLSSLPASFRNLADNFLNLDPASAPWTDSTNYFVFNADVRSLNPVLNFFYPALQIGNHSHASGSYDALNTDVRMIGSFPSLTFGKNTWYNVSSTLKKQDDRLITSIETDSAILNGGFTLYNQDLVLTAGNDLASLGVSWASNEGPEYSGHIGMSGSFLSDSTSLQGFMVDLHPGQFVMNDTPWMILPANVLIKKGFLNIRDFEISSLGKKIMAHGIIAPDDEQDFRLELENLRLGQLSRLTGMNIDLAGEATGNLHYKRVDSIPIIISNLEIDSLLFNHQFLGSTSLDANWDDGSQNLKIALTAERSNHRVIDVSGDFTPKNRAVDFNIRLSDFDLLSLNPYVGDIANDLSGQATVNLTVDGTLKNPQLNGSIDFSEGSAIISYLNTRYITNDHVRIYRNNVYFEDFAAQDSYGNPAMVNGSVSNSNLKDFYISLNIDANNIECMNTTSSDNEVFYGHFFGTGNVGINGPPQNIRLTINATTEANTELFLPLYNASEVVSSDFLTFVSAEEEKEEFDLPELPRVSGMEMELEIDVSNDAQVQLIFDPQVGDVIQTRGIGNVRLLLDRDGSFKMFGDVVLSQGEYIFTLQNVINKKFKIEPGGKISFNGSPMNATVDLEAIYTTRAAPYNLYPDNDDKKEALKKRIPIECQLDLQGGLQSPDIGMVINMPTADAETRNLLENSTSTDEELMKQFLSLLVINNFYSVNGFRSQDLGSPTAIAGVTASELLSNQLSSWLSQISDDFDIGINYRPGDQVTRDEVEVALSTQLLNDRIIISGNVDVGGQETNPSVGDASNPYIMGDFDVEFRVTDNVSVFAFNRARDELLFDTDPYKQGVGVSYREEFNNLNQLFSRYKEGIRNRKKKRKKGKNPELNK